MTSKLLVQKDPRMQQETPCNALKMFSALRTSQLGPFGLAELLHDKIPRVPLGAITPIFRKAPKLLKINDILFKTFCLGIDVMAASSLLDIFHCNKSPLLIKAPCLTYPVKALCNAV